MLVHCCHKTLHKVLGILVELGAIVRVFLVRFTIELTRVLVAASASACTKMARLGTDRPRFIQYKADFKLPGGCEGWAFILVANGTTIATKNVTSFCSKEPEENISVSVYIIDEALSFLAATEVSCTYPYSQ